jgi:hypothetical protein
MRIAVVIFPAPEIADMALVAYTRIPRSQFDGIGMSF